MLLNCGVEDSLESLNWKENKPVHPKGNQPWIFIGRTDAEAEAPILWPPDVKSWLFGKVLDFGGMLLLIPWILTGRADAEAEAPILWPPDSKSRLIGKDPKVGKDWGQEKGVTEDEMVGWHHWLNGHEFEQTLGDSEEQRSRTYCSPWGCSHTWRRDWATTQSAWWIDLVVTIVVVKENSC